MKLMFSMHPGNWLLRLQHLKMKMLRTMMLLHHHLGIIHLVPVTSPSHLQMLKQIIKVMLHLSGSDCDWWNFSTENWMWRDSQDIGTSETQETN